MIIKILEKGKTYKVKDRQCILYVYKDNDQANYALWIQGVMSKEEAKKIKKAEKKGSCVMAITTGRGGWLENGKIRAKTKIYGEATHETEAELQAELVGMEEIDFDGFFVIENENGVYDIPDADIKKELKALREKRKIDRTVLCACPF